MEESFKESEKIFSVNHDCSYLLLLESLKTERICT